MTVAKPMNEAASKVAVLALSGTLEGVGGGGHAIALAAIALAATITIATASNPAYLFVCFICSILLIKRILCT